MWMLHTTCLVLLFSLTSCIGHGYQLQQQTSLVSVSTPTPIPTPAVPQKLVQALPIERDWGTNESFTTHSVSETHDGYAPYEILAKYPRLKGQNRGVKQFNRWIKKKVLADVARFKWLELRAEPRLRRSGGRSITEGLELSFDIFHVNKNFVSLRLSHIVMAAGQTHPIRYYETINYDLTKHRQLQAANVFRPRYLKTFSAYSRKFLQDTYEVRDSSLFIEGTQARARNFPNWNLVPDGILISFEDYQIGPHSFGQAELIVPYAILGNVFRGKFYLQNSKGRARR